MNDFRVWLRKLNKPKQRNIDSEYSTMMHGAPSQSQFMIPPLSSRSSKATDYALKAEESIETITSKQTLHVPRSGMFVYGSHTEVPELQDVQGPKRTAPPLQPKCLGQICSFFGERPLI